MEHLNYSPLKSKNFQFMGRVMGFGLCQAPTSIGSDCIHTILAGLVEDDPRPDTTSVSMELKRPGEIHIDKDRHGGAQFFQVIKGLLRPVLPPDGGLFLASILT